MRKVTNQKVPCGWSERVVEAIAPDVDSEDDAAYDVQKVEDSQVLRDCVVDGWRAGRGCVESGEIMLWQTKWIRNVNDNWYNW